MALLPCGIGYGLYLILITGIMEVLKYKFLKQILLLAITIYLLSIPILSWCHLHNQPLAVFIGEPNYILNFAIVGIFQINILEFKRTITLNRGI